MKLGLKVLQSKKGKKQLGGENESSWRSRLRRSRLVKFLPFLLLAFVVWIQQSLQYEVTRPIYIPIGQDSVDVSLGVQGRIPDYLIVQVRDKGIEHIRYSLEDIDTVQIRLLGERSKQLYVGLTQREVSEAISSRLSSSASIVQINYPELKIPVYRRIGKRLPVVLEGKPITANGYTIGELRLSPDSIMVYGDANILNGLSSIKTISWQDTLITQDIDREVALSIDKRLYSEVGQVRLSIKLAELTQQTFILPIEVLNQPAGYRVTPLPGQANVLVTLPRARFNELNEDMLRLTVDFSQVKAGSEEMSVVLSARPDWVVSYRVSPDIVQFVKEVQP